MTLHVDDFDLPRPASRTATYEPAVATVREVAGLMSLRSSSWLASLAGPPG